MPHIASITYTPSNIERKPRDRFARTGTDRAHLIADFGIEGDLKGGPRDRQLNIMLAEMVEQMRKDGYHADPGALGEQIVIAGLSAAQVTGTTGVINSDQLQALTSVQMGALTTAVINGLTSDQVVAIGSVQIAGLTSTQIGVP